MEPRKILIIQTAFLGDVVLATSLIEKLVEYFPDSQIDFLLRKGNESLLTNHPHLRKLLIWDKNQNKTGNLSRMIAHVRNEKYDLVINVQRFFSSGLLTVLSGARRSVGFTNNPLSFFFSKRLPHPITWKPGEKYIHEVHRNLSLIADLTDTKFVRPALYPSAEDKSMALSYGSAKDYITVSPSSVWFTKQVPAEVWIEFIKRQSYRVFLLGAPADVDLCERISSACSGSDVIVLAGKLKLLQSAALMERAVMNFSNDSAPLHLATAMNAPVTAVYCSTIPEFGFGPLSDVSHVVQVRDKPPCLPCGLHGRRACPLGHFDCSKINVDDLISVLP